MALSDLQAGWIVHRRPWRESSLLIEFLARDAGRVGLVARGARSARSAWRGLAEPFMPLQASWTRRGELGTLTGLEPAGRQRRLGGRALWCGLYANELLLRLLERDDPHPSLFDAYGELLAGLVAGELAQSLLLRRFELALLTEMGVAPDLGREADGRAIESDGLYHLQPETGLVAVDRRGPAVFSGAAVQALSAGWTDHRGLAREMREMMRLLIDHQLGGRELKSRRLLAGASHLSPRGSQS